MRIGVSAILDGLGWLTTPDNWTGRNGIGKAVLQHLWYSLIATALATAIALPIGLVIGHTGRGRFVAANVSGLWRAIPTIGVVTLVFRWRPLSIWPVLVALVILAIPPIVLNTVAGIDSVPGDVRDAATGMGLTGRQALWRVEIPNALPLILAGIRSAANQVIATVSVAGFVGLGTLGVFIFTAAAHQPAGRDGRCVDRHHHPRARRRGHVRPAAAGRRVARRARPHPAPAAPGGDRAADTHGHRDGPDRLSLASLCRRPRRSRNVNMRRTIPLVLAPLLVLAAACGDDDPDTTSETTAASAPAATEAPAATDAPDGTAAETTTGGSAAPGDTAGGGGGAITIGSADFPESQLLAQIYGQALAEAGFDVDYQLAIGAREIYFDAIESGEVDLVPEYTNSLLSFVLRRDDPDALPEATNVEEQIAELGEVLPEGLEVLTPSTAEDKDVIVCTSEVAEEFGLTNLTDLGEASPDITIGAPPEFETRAPFGLVGFQEIYGADFGDFVPLDIGAVADALAAGEIDCGNLFSTMSVITTEGFVALEDDKGAVPNEAVLPLVRSEVVDDTLTATLDEVNSQLDTDTLKELMVKVEVEAAAPDVVAEEWLASLN